MSKQNIKKLFDTTNELLTELAVVSNKYGYHLDNDLENGLLGLLLDNNYNEMYLLKMRVETAIKQIKEGTFKLSKNSDMLTGREKVA